MTESPHEVIQSELSIDNVAKLKRYTNLFGPSYGTESFAPFLHSLIRMERPKTLVEFGTGYGVSALWMALALQANGDGHLWTFDDGSHFPQDRLQLIAATLRREMSLAASANEIESLHSYLKWIAKNLGLADRITFVPAHLKDGAAIETLRGAPGFAHPIDLFFSDYESSAPGLYLMLGELLPYIADQGSIFLDSVSTYYDTFVALERLVMQLNEQRIPNLIGRNSNPEQIALLRHTLETNELRLLHLLEPGKAKQNSRAWLRKVPVDLIPFSPELLSW
jgi:hypothetical protein